MKIAEKLLDIHVRQVVVLWFIPISCKTRCFLIKSWCHHSSCFADYFYIYLSRCSYGSFLKWGYPKNNRVLVSWKALNMSSFEWFWSPPGLGNPPCTLRKSNMANWEGKFWSHQRVPLVAWFQYVPYKFPWNPTKSRELIWDLMGIYREYIYIPYHISLAISDMTS